MANQSILICANCKEYLAFSEIANCYYCPSCGKILQTTMDAFANKESQKKEDINLTLYKFLKAKTIETRTWKTNFRGQILLHASKYPKSLISGKIFAVASIVDCRAMQRKDEESACCKFYPKANSWILSKIFPIRPPIDCKGYLGLWNLKDEDIRLKLHERLRR